MGCGCRKAGVQILNQWEVAHENGEIDGPFEDVADARAVSKRMGGTVRPRRVRTVT